MPPAVAPLSAVESKEEKLVSGASGALQRMGISIELKTYQGEPGECAKWWKEMQRVFVTSNIVSLDQRFLVVSDRLRGDARVAFWQFFEEAEVVSEGSGKAVDAIMALMVALYDQGQQAQLCMRFRYLRQMKNESMVKFRNRYMEVVVGLRAFGWAFSDEQIVSDVQTRVRDWASITTYKPVSMNEIVLAAGAVEGSANGPAVAVPSY